MVAGQAVAGGLQQAGRAGVESGEVQRAARVIVPCVMDLPLHVRGDHQLRPTGAESFDPQGLGGAVQQAHALRQRPPVLVAVAGRVRGSA